MKNVGFDEAAPLWLPRADELVAMGTACPTAGAMLKGALEREQQLVTAIRLAARAIRGDYGDGMPQDLHTDEGLLRYLDELAPPLTAEQRALRLSARRLRESRFDRSAAQREPVVEEPQPAAEGSVSVKEPLPRITKENAQDYPPPHLSEVRERGAGASSRSKQRARATCVR